MSVLFSKRSESCFCGKCWVNIGVGITPYITSQPEGEINVEKFDKIQRIFDRYNDLVDRMKAEVQDVLATFQDELDDFLNPADEGKYNPDYYKEEAAARTLAMSSWRVVLKECFDNVNSQSVSRVRNMGEELIHTILMGMPRTQEVEPPNPFAENPFATLLRMMGPPSFGPNMDIQRGSGGFSPEVEGITDQKERVLKKLELVKQKLGINGNQSPLDNLFNSIDPGTQLTAQVPGDELPQELKDMADENGFIDLRGKTSAIPDSLMPLLGIALLGALTKGMIRKADEVGVSDAVPNSDDVPAGQFIDNKQPFVNPVFNG